MADGESPEFGQRLRQLRESAGLTQEELAERAGLSAKAIGSLERGHRKRPYPATIRALADALGLSEPERAELAGTMPSRDRQTGTDRHTQPSLPVAPTALIGRERELAEVTSLLTGGTARLVTLTGAGGVGKTRLALELASRQGDAFPGGVGFVPLAPLSDPTFVLPAVAQSLGLAEIGNTTATELLTAHLAGESWLLVLDNFEHVVAIASDVADLLSACPRLTILVTSRAPLKIRAESEYPVRPLALPDMSRVPTPAEIEHVDSVRLFLERARAAVPAFDLTQANCAAVAAICRRLDGLPLALELVAARVRALSPTELLARLDQLLPLLVGGSRDLPQRQQTMRAAINWSYELLHPAEQAVFRRLSVFAGGWTLNAAEAVVAWGDIAVEDVIDLLTGLVEQSLVVAESGFEGTTRYRMLEPVRQFAAARVEEVGERTEVAERHFAWCLALAQQATREFAGPAQQQWLDRLEHEHDNLRAALAWCEQDSARGTSELRLAVALWRFWETRSHLTEGRRWLEHALTVAGEAPPELRAEGFNTAGNLARDQGDNARAVELIEASLALRRELDDAEGLANSLNDLANIVSDQSEYEQATLLYDEALTLYRLLEIDWGISIALNNLGIVLGNRGDYAGAAARLSEAIVMCRRMGETALRAKSVDALGVIMLRQGDLARAAELHEESLALRQEIGDTRGAAIALNHLGQVARYRGDDDEALRLMEEALRVRRTLGARSGIAFSLSSLADVARRLGDTTRALALYQEAIDLRRRIGISEGLPDCLLGLASIANHAGNHARAAQLLGASDAVREATHQIIHPVDRADYEHTVSAIQHSLPAEEYHQAWAAGRAMTLEQAIADALNEHVVAG